MTCASHRRPKPFHPSRPALSCDQRTKTRVAIRIISHDVQDTGLNSRARDCEQTRGSEARTCHVEDTGPPSPIANPAVSSLVSA